MKAKTLAAALLVLVAVGAIFSSSAMAENEYENTASFWYTGESPGTKLTGTKEVTASSEGALDLESTVGGKALKVEATGLECVGCVLENSGERALVKGKLKYTGLKLLEPEPTVCSVPSTMETKALTSKVGMEVGSTTASALETVPTEGETFSTLEIKGEKCSVSGLFKVTGKLFSRFQNPTGSFLKRQFASWSKTLQQKLGQLSSFKIGASAANWLGGFSFNLSVEFANKNK